MIPSRVTYKKGQAPYNILKSSRRYSCAIHFWEKPKKERKKERKDRKDDATV